MPLKTFQLLVILLTAAVAAPAYAEGLSVMRTEDLRLIYIDATQSYLAPHVARCFENSMQFQRQVFDYTPSQDVAVLLKDLSDGGNAGASTIPRNMLLLEMSPLSFAYETILGNERMNTLLNHELVHIAVQDQSCKADRRFRGFFRGKVNAVPEHPETILYLYLTVPRFAAPRWYQEGIAVFIDTWMAGGLGRAQGAWDEMVFRSMVRDDSRFYDPLGLVSEGTKIDFQVGVHSYLYGTRFMSYLAHQYGPESVIRWVKREEGSKRYYSAAFKQEYGRPLPDVWQDWIDWERGFQESNLAQIREYPTTPHRDLSDRALGSVSRAYLDEERGEIYAAFNYPGAVAHIGAISVDDGSVEKLVDVKDPTIYSVTSLTYDPVDNTIFYTTDNNEYRDLRAVDPQTGQSRLLMQEARIGNLAFNLADRSIWGVRHFNGIVTLARVPHPYEQWEQIYSWPYGEVVYDIDVSPDGTLLSASVGEISGRQTLQVMSIESLMEKDTTPVAELDFQNTIPSNFVFAPDGKSLIGSSYYTGVSNIFRFVIDTGELEALSNAETGLFQPIPRDDGSLIVFRYTGEGFVPATIASRPIEDVNPITFLGQQIAEKHPVVRDWKVGSPADVPLDTLLVKQGEYQPIKSTKLESIHPVIQGYKDLVAYGARVNFSDSLGLNRFGLTVSYSPYEDLPDNERAHVVAEYERHDWHAGFKLNGADFYDLVGPTKTSRKGYAVGVGWSKNLIYDTPRRMDLAVENIFYGNLERLPDYQNVEAAYQQLLVTEIGLSYDNVRASLGAVDGEKGQSWSIALANSYVNDDSIPSLHTEYDLGFALPLAHSSIWLRTSAGGAYGDRDDAFANFFFGGFGNNYVDYRSAKRYRRYYAFPGTDLNEIAGKTYARTMLEWNLPPLRFRRAGRAGFHAIWARTSLFASGLVANPDDADFRRSLANVGAQVDVRLSTLSRLNLTLSFGAAIALERGEAPRDEFMLSLKLLN